MSFTNFSISNASNFGSLVTLICHLIIGGNFRVAQLTYDVDVIDNSILHELNCLNEIVWLSSDIHSPAPLRNYQTESDHTIQLIFLNFNLSQNWMHLEHHGIFHRLFIFIADTATQFYTKRTFEFCKNKIVSAQGSLLLIHDCNTDETKVQLFTQQSDESPIHVQNRDSLGVAMHLFQQLFGASEEMWLIGAETGVGFDCQPPEIARRIPIMITQKLLANLYFSKMNLDFIRHTIFKCGDSKAWSSLSFVRHAHRAIYNEFSSQTEPSSNETM